MATKNKIPIKTIDTEKLREKAKESGYSLISLSNEIGFSDNYLSNLIYDNANDTRFVSTGVLKVVSACIGIDNYEELLKKEEPEETQRWGNESLLPLLQPMEERIVKCENQNFDLTRKEISNVMAEVSSLDNRMNTLMNRTVNIVKSLDEISKSLAEIKDGLSKTARPTMVSVNKIEQDFKELKDGLLKGEIHFTEKEKAKFLLDEIFKDADEVAESLIHQMCNASSIDIPLMREVGQENGIKIITRTMNGKSKYRFWRK